MGCVVWFHLVHSEDQQQTLRTRQRTCGFHKMTNEVLGCVEGLC